MKIGSWILGMRRGNMSYIKFNLVLDKRGGRSPLPPVKIQIPPILMKFKPYVLVTK